MTKQELIKEIEGKLLTLVDPLSVDYSRLYPYLSIQEALTKREEDYYEYKDKLEALQGAVVILKEEIRKAQVINKAMDILKLP